MDSSEAVASKLDPTEVKQYDVKVAEEDVTVRLCNGCVVFSQGVVLTMVPGHYMDELDGRETKDQPEGMTCEGCHGSEHGPQNMVWWLALRQIVRDLTQRVREADLIEHRVKTEEAVRSSLSKKRP